MPFTYVKVAVATGTSVNTAFSAIYSSLPLQPYFHIVAQNNTSSCVNFAIATTLPASNVLDQFFVPASGYAWWDCNHGESLGHGGAGGLNLYARVDDPSIVSGTIRIALK